MSLPTGGASAALHGVYTHFTFDPINWIAFRLFLGLKGDTRRPKTNTTMLQKGYKQYNKENPYNRVYTPFHKGYFDFRYFIDLFQGLRAKRGLPDTFQTILEAARRS